jgi:hypothetical protein
MAGKANVPDPSVRDPWIQAMIDRAKLPMALMEGTSGLQKKVWLPQHPNETDDDWEYRRQTTRLRNYFKRTTYVQTGKLFAKPFQLKDPIRIIQEVAWDVDREGTDIQAFAKDLMLEALGTAGISFFLVDRDATPAATAADDQVRAKAPYWVKLPLTDLISIRSTMIAGKRSITHLRYYRLTEKVLNEFESQWVVQIRVLEPTRWRVFELRSTSNGRRKRDTWVQVDEGTNTLGQVTLVPVYLNRVGYMMGENPLDDLADMNLEHFQLRSEQRRALQVNSFPMLAVLNYDGDLKDIVVGPNNILGVSGAEGKNADIKFIESQGNHLEAGRNEINDLVDQMRAFGAQFDKPGEVGTVESASGRVIDAAEASSTLQLWALLLKDSVELGLYYTDLWLGGDGSLARVGKVDMNLDFSHMLSEKDMEIIVKARQLGDLSRHGFLNVLKMNSKLPEDFDVNANDTELEDEPLATTIPPTGATGG